MCTGSSGDLGARDHCGCRPHRASEGHGRSHHGGGDSLLVIYAPGAPEISLGYHLAGEDLSSRGVKAIDLGEWSRKPWLTC